MRRLALLVAASLAACGGKHHDTASRCAGALAHLRSIGVLPAISARMDALGFGMACKDMTDDDLACVNGVKTPEGVTTCKHAGLALVAVVVDLRKLGAQGSTGGAPAELADAVCACADEACLVQLGETRGEAIRKAGPGKDTDRLRACIETQPAPVKKP